MVALATAARLNGALRLARHGRFRVAAKDDAMTISTPIPCACWATCRRFRSGAAAPAIRRGDLGRGGRGRCLVRSFRGTNGRWYRDLAAGGPAIEFGGRQLAVQAMPANDKDRATRQPRIPDEVRRRSYAQAMVRPDLLATTLRLEPR